MKNLNISIFIILTATLVVSGFFILINKAQAATLEVCPDGCIYTSIQAAIGAATAGDTINVAAGTYEERITIGKELTIQSTDGAENTIIDGNGVCNNVVNIWHENVRFEGFTVTNPLAGACADAGGIYVQDPSNLDATLVNNVYVLNNIVEVTKNPSEGTSAYGPAGIIIGPSSDVTVSGNIIRNLHNSPDVKSDHTTGINVWGNDETSRPFNIIISNNTVSDTDDYGILLEYADNVQIIDNTVSNVEIGIFLNSWGGSHFVSNVGLSGNTLQDNDIGIGLKYSNNVITIESNTIKNNAQEGIYIDSAQGNSFDISVHYNEITGNTAFGVNNAGTETLNAENNWWGATTGPNAEGADGTEGDVDFVPFYTDSEMTTLSTEYSVCDVGCNFINIQDAIDAATSGDIINVAAGTYNEQVVIDKQLTLNGANADVNAVTGIRGSESIIDGGTSTAITISADNVIVDGFTLDGGITLNDLANPISNGAISNNLITGANSSVEPTKAQNGIRLGWDYGVGVDHITIENNIISDNGDDVKKEGKGIRFANTKEHKGGPPQHTSYITISGNEIEDNVSAGIETYGPGSNTIINNTISGNGGNGINLKFDDGDIVTGNTITKNTGPGITLRQVTNSVVENNTVSGHISEVVIGTCPDVPGGKGSGIHIFDISENNTIRFNEIKENNYGIFIHNHPKGDLRPSNNSIAQNKIVDNEDYGILNALVDPAVSVNAIGNYWGDDDETGPEHVTTNTSGSGDEVSDNVSYSPWYTDIELTSLKAPITTDGTGNTVLLTQPIEIISNDIIVSMPAGISITATASWEGIINAPSIELVALDTPSPESGHKTTIDTIIEIGFSNIKLVFDKAVKILIPNQAGKRVGYVRPDEDFQEITNVCSNDIQPTDDSFLPPEGDCKRDVDNDLVVWTKHFTQFIVYSYSPIIVGPTFRAEILPEEEPSALSEEAQKLDTNKDDKIDDLDLKELFTNWGSIILDNIADFNNDSKVDVFDFNLLMVHWTE